MIHYRNSQKDSNPKKSIAVQSTAANIKSISTIRAGSNHTEIERSDWRGRVSAIIKTGLFTQPTDCLFCVKCPETSYYPLMINRALFTKY